MSSAKGYDHDVFISYATVDDWPAKCGWVSAFVRNLEQSLAAAFGLRDPDRIWWDRSNIDEEASLTEQIRTRVQKSACMVVILSQGYVKSQWCRQERDAFLAAVAGQPEADRRLFLIDIGNLDQQDRPNVRKRGQVHLLVKLDLSPVSCPRFLSPFPVRQSHSPAVRGSPDPAHRSDRRSPGIAAHFATSGDLRSAVSARSGDLRRARVREGKASPRRPTPSEL